MPNSVLWVCLVAIWLFVLVPMVIKGRPEVRKTTEATLATRVINRGGRAMARATSKVASGRHPHDAEWVAPAREYRKRGELLNDADDHADARAEVADDEPEVDVDEVAAERVETSDADTATDTTVAAEVDDETDTEETDADATDLEVGYDEDDVDETDAADEMDPDVDDADDDYEVVAEPLTRRGRGGYDADADSRRSETRYRRRQRVVMALAVVAVASIGVGVFLGGMGWAVTGVGVALLVAYMAFLRRAVRVEERIRRQRAARAARAARQMRPGVRDHDDAGGPLDDEIPLHLRRPGAVVLEIDDEHPVFEHLPPFQRRRVMREDSDLARVVGQ
ncbi:divisome protein SepX/GlpR [Williamsia sp. MIQD14]|uniref:divisome protein SepX/GlpR n=1 Tax=Williamsia sp. MIQD14 TaxID=3425703 RepID=UPI003DA0CDB1